MKTILDFQKAKQEKTKLTMITAYDYPSAKLVEEANTDMILVGDSLGMVVLGYDSTIFVTLDDMVHHTKAVRRGAKNTFIISDMPFATYHANYGEVLKNAVILMQAGGANAVKLEGEHSEVITLLTKAGIPVVAHLGLTPQSVGVLGGYRVQAKTENEVKLLIEDAKKVQAAGAIMLVMECVLPQVGKYISQMLSIPVIGIGAGKDTDGQVLVYHDLLYYGVDRLPKFVKSYCNLNQISIEGLKQFNQEVREEKFPSTEHTFNNTGLNINNLYGGKNGDS